MRSCLTDDKCLHWFINDIFVSFQQFPNTTLLKYAVVWFVAFFFKKNSSIFFSIYHKTLECFFFRRLSIKPPVPTDNCGDEITFHVIQAIIESINVSRCSFIQVSFWEGFKNRLFKYAHAMSTTKHFLHSVIWKCHI